MNKLARQPAAGHADDIFFTGMSLLMLAIVVVGFAPSYFLQGAVFAHLPSLLIHLHGAVFSCWIILFVIQCGLVSAGNVRLHRKLGVLGAVIAGLMLILGFLAPFGTLRRAAVLPSFFTPASFLIGNCLGIIVFGAIVAVAIGKRNSRPTHKRLMLIANATLMSPAIGRMNFPVILHNPFLIGLFPLGIVLALLVFDLFTRKRPLAATIGGALVLWVFNPVSDAIIKTPVAQQLTAWAQTHP